MIYRGGAENAELTQRSNKLRPHLASNYWKRIVDYDKLDADLSAELDGVAADSQAATLPIFIHTEQPPDHEQQSFLKKLGVSGEIAGRDVLTANLSPGAIDELSRQPWVRYLKLSRKLRPLPGPK